MQQRTHDSKHRSRAGEPTVDAPHLPVFAVIIEWTGLATVTLAAITVAVVPLVVVEIEIHPLLARVILVIRMVPREAQRVAATDEVENANGAVVDAALGWLAICEGRCAIVPFPGDVLAFAVPQATHEDRGASSVGGAWEVLYETDVEVAPPGGGVALDQAGLGG